MESHRAALAAKDAIIKDQAAELALYRERYPGWSYNRERKWLYSVGDHESCLEGE